MLTRSRLPLVIAAAVVASLALVPAAATNAATTAAPAHGPATGVLVSPAAIGPLRLGQTLAYARRVWGNPDATFSRRGLVSSRWRNDDGMLAYVRGRGGRIVSIEVEGPVFRTARGDGYGTKVALFRRHWPGARRYRDCCSASVVHYTVHARQPGKLLVFTFASDFGLRRVGLTSEAHFRACYVAECD